MSHVLSLPRWLDMGRLWPRRGGWAAVRRRPGASVKFPARIDGSRDALRDFGRISDEEFSALAQGLSRINARLGSLRAQAKDLDGVLQDRDDSRALAAAQALFDASLNVVRTHSQVAASAREELGEVERGLGESGRTQGVFERNHLFLQIVTLSIRIEASRLPAEGQSVFLNVASAIAETSGQIQNCTARAFNQLQEVLADSQAVRVALHEAEGALAAQARKCGDVIARELQGLRAALAPCGEHSAAIATTLTELQPQVFAVIGALQHQDIVRQKVEHVGEGFEDLRLHLETPAAVEWGYVNQAGRIQAAQLEAARQEISEAGAKVTNGLRGLLERSTALIERFAAMETIATGALEGCRVAAIFAEELEQLNRTIDDRREVQARTARLVDRIEGVVSLFSEEIGRYELDVKIVALNAQIAAARVSSADALNALAEQTSRVADENARVSRQLSSGLQAQVGRLHRVKRGTEAFIELAANERTELESGLRGVSEKLAGLVQRVRDGCATVRRDFEPVHAECDALLTELRFPELIEDAFSPAAELCRELVGVAASQGGRHGSGAARSQRLEAHRRRYTMEREKTTHAAALEGHAPSGPVRAAGADTSTELFPETAPPATTPASPEPARASGADDGIELF